MKIDFKPTFKNLKKYLDENGIDENSSINIFGSEKELNILFKTIFKEDPYWNISIKSDVHVVAKLLVRYFMSTMNLPKIVERRWKIIMLFLSQNKQDFKVKEEFIKVFDINIKNLMGREGEEEYLQHSMLVNHLKIELEKKNENKK